MRWAELAAWIKEMRYEHRILVNLKGKPLMNLEVDGNIKS
jgi:hypothetical protein